MLFKGWIDFLWWSRGFDRGVEKGRLGWYVAHGCRTGGLVTYILFEAGHVGGCMGSWQVM